MDVLPLSLAAVPDTGLLRLHGAGHAAGIHVLGQPNVGNARCVFPNQMHVWVQQDGVHWFIPFRQGWKEETMADYMEQIPLYCFKTTDRCIEYRQYI